ETRHLTSSARPAAESRLLPTRGRPFESGATVPLMAERTRFVDTSHFRVTPKSKVRLSEHDPAGTEGIEKRQGKAASAELVKHLDRLQELLYADGRHKVLVILQGVDA